MQGTVGLRPKIPVGAEPSGAGVWSLGFILSTVGAADRQMRGLVRLML